MGPGITPAAVRSTRRASSRCKNFGVHGRGLCSPPQLLLLRSAPLAAPPTVSSRRPPARRGHPAAAGVNAGALLSGTSPGAKARSLEASHQGGQAAQLGSAQPGPARPGQRASQPASQPASQTAAQAATQRSRAQARGAIHNSTTI